MGSLRDRILAALDHQFRSSAEIAKRAGIDATSAAPALGHLRRQGRVESCMDGDRTLWRRWPSPALGRSPR